LVKTLQCLLQSSFKPTKTEEFAVEGSSVTLSCSYSSARSLFWYRQYPGSAPEFLVTLTYRATEAKKLSAKITKREQKHVDLIISPAAVSDSALYYCALRPTVTGNTSALYKNLVRARKNIDHTILNSRYDIHTTYSTVLQFACSSLFPSNIIQ
uniref:Ig-like domain-containing protein n=1 Tax=Cyprinus carpio TaxID=7962 RepID=A0A8C2FCI7_CYPCA